MSTSATKESTDHKVNIWGAKPSTKKDEHPKDEESKAVTKDSANKKTKSKSRVRKEKPIASANAAANSLKNFDGEVRIRKHNVIIVRKNTTFKTLVIMAKNLLKKQFDTIELHAIDEQSYLTITLVSQCLLKYKYVTLARLKTKTVQIYDEEDGNRKHHDDHTAKLQPRLIVHLTKTKDFDDIYDDFEAKFKKMLEEHQEDIENAKDQDHEDVAEEEE